MRSVLRRHELRLSSGLAFPVTGCLSVCWCARRRVRPSGGGPAARPRLPGPLPRVPVHIYPILGTRYSYTWHNHISLTAQS